MNTLLRSEKKNTNLLQKKSEPVGKNKSGGTQTLYKGGYSARWLFLEFLGFWILVVPKLIPEDKNPRVRRD